LKRRQVLKARTLKTKVFCQFHNLVLLNDRQGRENKEIKLTHSWLRFSQKASSGGKRRMTV
jgi:hypothetical protein